MARQSKQDKQTRNRYSDEYKSEALALAARVGIASAAKQLGLNESQLYAWRGKAKREETEGESQRQLSAENVRLKRQLAEKEEELLILKKAAAYFAKHQK
jgi:transposase